MNVNKTVLFSEKLNKLIQKNNIKKTVLAKELGVSKSAVSNYVSGVSVPKIDMILKIAAFFGVSFEELIDTNSDKASFTLGEGIGYTCSIPLFHNMLNSDTVIFKAENFIGNITAPVFLPADSECYAVIVRDDSMKDYGIICGSLVIFDTETQPGNGELAAVFYRSLKRIQIRRVLYENDKVKLCYDDTSDEYKISKNEFEFTILGKVMVATFNPNNPK